MNALDVIRNWPALRALKPLDILASPAWRAAVTFEDRPARLTRTGADAADELAVSLAFDGEAHVLGFRDTALYPDLHLVWTKRAGLPAELLVALVEKECGGLLQLLENSARAEVKILGIAERMTSAARTAFELTATGKPPLQFSLDLPRTLVDEFGRLENLDPDNPKIRALERPVRAHYATLRLPSEESMALKAGDFLMLEDVSPRWIAENPNDASLHLVSADETAVALAAFADDRMPAVPALEDSKLRISRLGKPLFAARLAKVGGAFAVELQPLA